MKKALIVGATGFGGLGLIDIISKHPEMEIKQLTAMEHGKEISEMYPHLKEICNLKVDAPGDIDYDGIDIAFFATPDRVGMQIVGEFYKRGIPVIDFSGDFRFDNTEDYKVYADNKGMDNHHLCPELLKESVFGLPEKNRSEISGSDIIGNPGCFAMSMIAGLLPAVEAGLIDESTIICDGKTGVSGAGINPGQANSYSLRYDNINTYREGHHQHLVEVEKTLNRYKKGLSDEIKIFFVPQIVPINRGIITTMYAKINENISSDSVFDIYKDFYSDSPFIEATKRSPETTGVRGTNKCVVRPMVDKRTGRLFVTSVIDNLMKGQSGNAVQNANIRLGLDENLGLNVTAFYP